MPEKEKLSLLREENSYKIIKMICRYFDIKDIA